MPKKHDLLQSDDGYCLIYYSYKIPGIFNERVAKLESVLYYL